MENKKVIKQADDFDLTGSPTHWRWEWMEHSVEEERLGTIIGKLDKPGFTL